MKSRLRVLLALIVISVATSIWAAAPVINDWAKFIGAATTIDSQYTADQWELLDSIIVIKTDTCYTLYTMTGVAVLDPYDKLYVGFDDGGGAAGLPVDTFIFSTGQDRAAKKARIPFSVTYLDSLMSQTDANDTIYFYMAVGGGSNREKVSVEGLVLTAEVLDFNAGGVIGE